MGGSLDAKGSRRLVVLLMSKRLQNKTEYEAIFVKYSMLHRVNLTVEGTVYLWYFIIIIMYIIAASRQDSF